MLFAVVISSIGATAGFFLGLVAWLRDRTKSWQTIYLSLMAAAVAATMLEDALVVSRVYDHIPELFGWSYPAFVFIGPFLQLYIDRLANPLNQSLRNHWRLLVTVTLLLIVLLPWYLAGGHVRWAIELGLPIHEDRTQAVWSMILFMISSTVLQVFCFMRAYLRAAAIRDAVRRSWALRLTRFSLMGCAAYVICLLLNLLGFTDDLLLSLLNLLLAISLYSLTLLAILEPPDPLTQPVGASVTGGRYAKSALKLQDMDRIMRRVDQLVEQQKVHRDSALTLQKLAKQTGVSPNDLSQTLNTRADGFYAWLSRMRVNDVKTQLLQGQEISGLLDAAFLVGFNSKSTFYEAFRRETGKTPAAWLKAATAKSMSEG